MEMNGTETFLSHIKCIIENETLKIPFIFTEKQMQNVRYLDFLNQKA